MITVGTSVILDFIMLSIITSALRLLRRFAAEQTTHQPLRYSEADMSNKTNELWVFS